MFKLWACIQKDIQIIFKDTVGMAMMFAMPIVLVFLITAIQNTTFQLVNKTRVVILVDDHDHTVLSQDFSLGLRKTGMFELIETSFVDKASALNRMRSHNALLALRIPAGFSEKIQAEAKLNSGRALKSFGLQADSSKQGSIQNTLTLFYQPVLQASYRFSIERALKGAIRLLESRETLRAIYQAINEKPLPANLEVQMLSDHSQIEQIAASGGELSMIPNASQHNIPAWTIFAMFFITVSLGGSIVREKTSGSFLRLKTMPTPFWLTLASKELTYLVVTLLQALLIFFIGIFIFPALGFPKLSLPGDLAGLVIVTFICGLSAVSYAITVGVLARTQEQANGFGAVSIVMLAAIGGLMVPSFAMPGSFINLIKLSPLHWCLECYYGLFLEGGTLKDLIPDFLPLLGMIVILHLIIFAVLRKRHLL